ncbi:MAG: hypothetical protein FJZ85_03355 [Chloroflexi bacterium]|nr:hypothetical protein [Chloroflexota bacterium]
MVIGNGSSWEEQTRRFLSDTLSELNKVESQINELEVKRMKLAEEVKAWEMALEGYLKRTGRRVDITPEWYKTLRDQTHKERILTIAKNSGGSVKASEATDILYTKGFIKAKKRSTAYSMVQRFLIELAEEGKLEKVAPAEYRLLGAQQSLIR